MDELIIQNNIFDIRDGTFVPDIPDAVPGYPVGHTDTSSGVYIIHKSISNGRSSGIR